MGFLKDLHTLNKKGNEIRRNTDVGATMANSLAMMQATNTMMQQQVANGQLAVTGVEATATVVAVRQTGAFLNMDPIVQIDLLVMHGAPVPVTHQEAVPMINVPRLMVGASIAVKVDPADVRRLWIDWSRTR